MLASVQISAALGCTGTVYMWLVHYGPSPQYKPQWSAKHHLLISLMLLLLVLLLILMVLLLPRRLLSISNVPPGVARLPMTILPQYRTLALVGTSPLTTMPLPRFSSGLIPFPTVVLASMWAALRKEVVDRKSLAVRQVAATFKRTGAMSVARNGRLLVLALLPVTCVPIVVPLVHSLSPLIIVLPTRPALLVPLTCIPCTTRCMTILTRPLPTLMFRAWQAIRILPTRQLRIVDLLYILNILRGSTEFLATYLFPPIIQLLLT